MGSARGTSLMLRYMPKPVPAGIMWPMMTFSVFEDDNVFHAGGFVDFLADGDADDEVAEVDLASPTPSSHRVLANLVAHRQNGSFPMIENIFPMVGKFLAIFPMIGKIFRAFSNDWKKVSGSGLALRGFGRGGWCGRSSGRGT